MLSVPQVTERKMHELSVINSVIKQVNQVAEENHIAEVASVKLKIGEVSGIVNEYLIDYWKWAVKKHEHLRRSELVIENTPAVSWCEDCQSRYPTVQYGRTCPRCGSGSTYLLEGREFIISEMTVYDEEEA